VRNHYDEGSGVGFEWDVSLLDGYKHVFLLAVGARDRISFRWPLVCGLWRHLKRGCFDAPWLHDYANQTNLRALAIAKSIGLKVLLRGESHLNSSDGSFAKLAVKKFVLIQPD